MSDTSKRPLVTRTGRITGLLALTLPFLADAFIFGTTGQTEKIFDDPVPLVGFAAYMAVVFWLLDSAMRPRKRVRMALWVGLALTALIWFAFAYTGRAYQIDESFGNANLGIYMLLMAWPLICVVIMGVVAKVGEPDHVA